MASRQAEEWSPRNVGEMEWNGCNFAKLGMR